MELPYQFATELQVGAKVQELRHGSSSSVPELVKLSTHFKNDEGTGDEERSERIVR